MLSSRVVFLGLILSIQKLQIQGEKIPVQINSNAKNSLNDFTTQLKDTLQSIKSNDAELLYEKPEDFDDTDDDIEPLVSDVDFDNFNNALIVKFNKNFLNYHDPLEDNNSYKDDKTLESNFLRLTRSGNNNLMRFGKRQLETSKDQRPMDSSKSSSRYSRSSSTSRDSRGDNFMRFGRSNNNNLMRFGRATTNNMMRFGRSNNNLMRFGRSNSNLMRFGRSNSNLMRFGRSNSNLMRFGRTDPTSRTDSFIRFGRNSNNLMRFGRNDPGRMDGFIRFGRNANNLMRFGRNDRNFMRFGKLDQNFMRFGKRDEIFSGSHLDSDINNNKTNDNDNFENNIGTGFYNLNEEPDDINDVQLDD
ncbi:FMRFamide neuropeptides [Condylostylus longicornis]|uniref:FMRFamide neuropeptides n=1 Tax=Condylostylus longicornis TaxID=2530218 RepID=UPI00244DB583|nr:FMRFamide neuropeptides [Condylostylus longicornis]